MASRKPIHLEDIADRLEKLEAEVKELREIIANNDRRYERALQDTNRETKQAIGSLSPKPPSRG
jgi:prephenate dehydrogenase